MQPAIAGRYQLHEPLGHGGAGAVYCATDRLTGNTVALKRVVFSAATPSPGSPGASAMSDELRLMLANEFQTLASLRHPNIIGVLDYGFDEERQPYFTMEYLPRASTLVQAGLGVSVAERVDLLIQVLQALAYLHRRGILHRDLKPGNVLVIPPPSDQGTAAVSAMGSVAKVLDFGLSMPRDRAVGAAGTFAYMAPEVLTGQPADEAADLYALGVMAYELLAGAHPFDTADIGRLIVGILNSQPNLAAVQGGEALACVVGRLLAKDPAQRYASAEACIAALSQAVGQPPPVESAAIRESFLQAARFVGRDREMEQLSGALHRTMAGQGSAWLVGGESGVGKTRLLEELRTRALVAGATVLQGQAVREAGTRYQVWQEPLRWLALTADWTDLEAGILKLVVPDLEALLGRPVPDVPLVDRLSGQQRLLSAMIGAFRRQARPLVLILEDLHWVSEGLDVLKQLVRLAADRPLLVVGSFCDDEAPDLPAALPGVAVIMLERLSEAEVLELSASMLGEAGRQDPVVRLLQRESEGNTFFLVEVARALAEEAGRLSEIGHATLPARVFSEGIQTIVRRHLDRVPAEAHPLLRAAAVAGRHLDFAVLACVEDGPGGDLDDWLTSCANAGVLEVRDGRWRFAHDKLRDGLLATLPNGKAEEIDLHRQVAQAISRAYPGDLGRAAALAYHWNLAGDRVQEQHYAGLAGEYAAAHFANADALAYLGRALQLTPDGDREGRYALLLAREKVYDLRGDREPQRRDLAALKSLVVPAAGGPAPVRRQAEIALREANYARGMVHYPAAIAAVQSAIHLAQAAHDPGLEAAGYLLWGEALTRQGELEAARARLEQGLTLARAESLPQAEAESLRHLGSVYWSLGAYADAGVYYEQSLRLCRDIGDRRGESAVLNNLGLVHWRLGHFPEARAYLEQALHIRREIGFRAGEAYALTNLSGLAVGQGDFAGGRAYGEQAWDLYTQLGDRQGAALTLNHLGALAGHQGDYAAGRSFLEQALLICREIGLRHVEGATLNNLGLVADCQGDHAPALRLVEQALSISRELGDRQSEGPCLHDLGTIYHRLGDLDRARVYYEQALSISREVGDRRGEGQRLAGLSLLFHHLRDDQAACEHAQQALHIAQELGHQPDQAIALTFLGHALAELEPLGSGLGAATAYQQALSLRRAFDQPHLATEPLAGLARLALARGDPAQAQSRIQEIMRHLETGSLDGTGEPFRVYLTCYCVLQANGDPRAQELLSTAYTLLQERAARLSDEALRRSFLEKVAAHREIVSQFALRTPV